MLGRLGWLMGRSLWSPREWGTESLVAPWWEVCPPLPSELGRPRETPPLLPAGLGAVGQSLCPPLPGMSLGPWKPHPPRHRDHLVLASGGERMRAVGGGQPGLDSRQPLSLLLR